MPLRLLLRLLCIRRIATVVIDVTERVKIFSCSTVAIFVSLVPIIYLKKIIKNNVYFLSIYVVNF